MGFERLLNSVTFCAISRMFQALNAMRCVPSFHIKNNLWLDRILVKLPVRPYGPITGEVFESHVGLVFLMSLSQKKGL